MTRPEDEPTLVQRAGAGPFVAPGKRFGKFEILEELGRGGMGAVFKARETGLGRVVALKVLLSGALAVPELVERFRREARAAAAIRHPNLVSVYEIGQESGLVYFTMDHVDGRDLGWHLRQRRFAPAEAADLVRRTAGALEAVHAAGIVHRDVKPANILLSPEGEPLLTDFGLARLDGGDARLTASGTTLGTPAYMPPEQALRGGKAADRRGDVYSLGAVLYETLTGRPPFEGESVAEVLHRAAYEEPVRPRELVRDLPPALEAICVKAMAREPAERYADAGEFARDLERFLSGRATRARAPRRRPAPRRVPVLAIAVGAVSIAILAAVGWLLARDEPAPVQEAQPETPGKSTSPARPSEADRFHQRALEAYAEVERLLRSPAPDAPSSLPEARRRAIDLATLALEADPGHVEARLLRGRAFRGAKRFDEAEQDFSVLVQERPDLAGPSLERARTRLASIDDGIGPTLSLLSGGIDVAKPDPASGEIAGRRRAAEADLARSVERGGDSGARDAAILRARAIGDPAGVLEVARDVRRDDVSAVDALLARGIAAYLAERFDDAEADLQAVLSFQPNRSEALQIRFLLGWARWKPEAALADADRLCAIHPDRARLHNARGLFRLSLGKFDAGLEDFARAIQLDPRFAWPRINRGLALLQASRLEEAIVDLDRALQIDPDSGTARGGRGNALLALRRPEEALVDLDECVRLLPRSARARYSRGNALLQLGRNDAAIEDYRRALAIDPSLAEARANEAQALYASGRHQEALDCAESALRIDPRAAQALIVRAQVRHHRNDARGAVEDYTAALALRPNRPELFLRRASARKDLGEVDAAIADLESYLHAAPAGPEREVAEAMIRELEQR